MSNDACTRGNGSSSDDNYGTVEPRVGPSFQAEAGPFESFEGSRVTEGTGRDDVLLWDPNTASSEVVDVFLRQAEQAIGTDPRMVGSVPELALEALYQAGGDLRRAAEALPSLATRQARFLWSEEETAELENAVAAHGTDLPRVHARISSCARTFPECVSQHARAVEMRPLVWSR